MSSDHLTKVKTIPLKYCALLDGLFLCIGVVCEVKYLPVTLYTFLNLINGVGGPGGLDIFYKIVSIRHPT